MREVLADAAGGCAALPLFPDPVVRAPGLAGALRGLHTALSEGAPRPAADEALQRAVVAMARHGATAAPRVAAVPERDAAAVASRAADVLRERAAENVGADELASAVGRSRFAVYRAFRAVRGMAPSDYQRQLRLRRARALIGAGVPLAEAAAGAGFADQGHLTRWFSRCYGTTPGAFRAADGRAVRLGAGTARTDRARRR
ncbi:helix-turn-helix domain-containing protein [Nocardiopsis sp. NPDC101807]|uniref:helix-turn-helix domain-containing protein n=1 Tax=Nocardiopsis sp. NPDC101807 TaxID=3364339 RepID=UPI003828F5B1